MMMLAMATGRRNFQPKLMSWSYRKRGSVPRTQMKSRRLLGYLLIVKQLAAMLRDNLLVCRKLTA